MNDELEMLRSFRPAAAGPTAAVHVEAKNALVSAIARARVMRRRHLRRSVVIAAVVSIAAASVAGATRIIPDDVKRTFGIATGDSLFPLKVNEAVERASAAAPGGATVELWTAQAQGGGICAFVRYVDAHGVPEPGGLLCQGALPGSSKAAPPPRPATEPIVSPAFPIPIWIVPPDSAFAIGGKGRLSVQSAWRDGRPFALYGRAPRGTSRVVVTWPGGTSSAPVSGDGWYVVVVPHADGHEAWVRIKAISPSGAALASGRLGTPADGPRLAP